MTYLLALADRVEKLTGPDREIDLAIHLAVHPDGDIARIVKHPRGLDHQEGYQWEIRGASVVFEKRTADGRCPHNGGYPLPQVTASLDAAMTLKPSEMCWNTGEVGEDDYPWACITDGDSKDYAATGATPALALTAAALRALASTKGTT